MFLLQRNIRDLESVQAVAPFNGFPEYVENWTVIFIKHMTNAVSVEPPKGLKSRPGPDQGHGP